MAHGHRLDAGGALKLNVHQAVSPCNHLSMAMGHVTEAVKARRERYRSPYFIVTIVWRMGSILALTTSVRATGRCCCTCVTNVACVTNILAGKCHECTLEFLVRVKPITMLVA